MRSEVRNRAGTTAMSANQLRPAEEEEDEGGNVDEGGQKRLAAFGEQKYGKEEKNVVVEVKVWGEQKRGCEAGAESDGATAGRAADLANEVDGGGEDEQRETQVEGEGDAGGKQVRAADIEKAVEGGHRFGVDGDDGLEALAFVRGDGG